MKMIKILTMLIALAFTPSDGKAQNGSWLDEGNYDTSWYTKDKTVYEISTARQLAGLCKLSYSFDGLGGSDGSDGFQDEVFKLVSDIDLSAHYWKPIHRFSDVFDGQGHRIKNMRIDFMDESSDGYGLFGLLYGGTVKNLVIDESCGFTLERAKYNSVFFGTIASKVSFKANIENCINNASFEFGGETTEVYTGGLIGDLDGTSIGTINNCTNNGNIIISQGSLGGIAGCNFISSGAYYVISNCINKGDLTAPYNVGGIFGHGMLYKITNCQNFGNILSPGKKNSSSKGGIVGDLHMMSGSEISGCINYGSVQGNDTIRFIQSGVAGIVGTMTNNTYGNENAEQKITNCLNLGTISGGNAAGIIGYSSNHEHGSVTQIIENCENLGTIDGYIESAGIISRTYSGGVVACQCRNAGKVTASSDGEEEKDVRPSATVYGIGPVPCVNSVNNGELYASAYFKGEGRVYGEIGCGAYCYGIGGMAINCYNTGKITAKSSAIQTSAGTSYRATSGVSAAGISSGWASNCYNTGQVEGTAYCSNASGKDLEFINKNIYGISTLYIDPNPDKEQREDIKNCYYSNEGLLNRTKGSYTGYHTIEEMRTPEFLALLNSGLEDYRPNEYTPTILRSCGWVSDISTGMPILDIEVPGITGIKDVTEVTKENNERNIVNDSDIVNVYNINGQRSSSLKKGLNIVRKKDGTIKKVLLK